jgi:hypothetical protein
MEWDVYNELQRLSMEPTAHNIRQLADRLNEFGTLSLAANQHGIYSASTALADDDTSGYQNAWLRDNVMIAFSKWFCGDRESAWLTIQGLQGFLQTQFKRFEEIINKPDLKEDISRRPRVRFNARTLQELPEGWAHAQNDALGAVIWLRFLMGSNDTPDGISRLNKEECALYECILRYLKAIQYWSDLDNGAWEETRKLNTSSVGAVLAGLRQVLRYGERYRDPSTTSLVALARELDTDGSPMLKQLPFESPPERKSDAVLLLLIFPFAIVDDLQTQNQILSLVRARLIGDWGVRRYIGDSYYCQNYDQWFPPSARSADFSTNIEFRDELLAPGQEAQWCLFDPLLSAIYGLRPSASREFQLLHFRRSIHQLTKDLRCPELYYLKHGRYVPNKHTPLAWTQANLAIALRVMERTATV